MEKDFYRLMKAETIIAKDLKLKEAKQQGRVVAEPLINLKSSKYKDVTDLVRHQYVRGEVPSDKLYMIDKVVRMRGLHGRFGIDHSELLNFEIEQTNKDRDEHMNWLVYKADVEKHTTSTGDDNLSKVLRERLQI